MAASNASTQHAAHTNRLIDEESPYLLQHAHNPVRMSLLLCNGSRARTREVAEAWTTRNARTASPRIKHLQGHIADNDLVSN